MSETRTITVGSYFGDKEVTKQEFVDIWYKHLFELRRLDYSGDWNQKVDDMAVVLRNKCMNEFERLYKSQNQEVA